MWTSQPQHQQPSQTVLVSLSSVRLLTTNLNTPQNGSQQYLVILSSSPSQSSFNQVSIAENQQIQHISIHNPFNQNHPQMLQRANPDKSRNAFYCESFNNNSQIHSSTASSQKSLPSSNRNMEPYPSTRYRIQQQTQQIHQTQHMNVSNTAYSNNVFICDVCSKAFKRKPNLKIHMVFIIRFLRV